MDGSTVVRSCLLDGKRVCAEVGANEKFGNVVCVVLCRVATALLSPSVAGELEAGDGEDDEASGAIVVVVNLVLILVIVVVVELSEVGAAAFELGAAPEGWTAPL